MKLRYALVLALALAACGTEEATQAVAGPCADVSGRIAEPDPDAAAAEEARSACEEAGVHCDARAYLTRETMTCLATEEGLAPGLREWTLSLRYDVRLERVVWNVQNIRMDAGEFDGVRQEGDVYVFDAATGELIDELGWSAIS